MIELLTWLPFVLVPAVFAAVIAVAVHTWRSNRRRIEEMALWATEHGFEFSHEDPHDLDRLDFHLFTLGDGRGCENVLTGTWEDMPVRLADYWYYDEDTNGKGHSSRTYHRFSVMVTTIAAGLPHVRIGHETAFSRLADKLGFDDVQFESEQFNRRFRVHAKDRQFAYELLDARMIEWLLATAGPHCYEVNGPWVLVHSKRLPPAKLTTLLHAGKGFVGKVPRLVWADYGTEREAGS